MTGIKGKSGGARKGAGNKPKYGEHTVNLTMRVPASKKEEIKKLVKKHLKRFEVKKPKKG